MKQHIVFFLEGGIANASCGGSTISLAFLAEKFSSTVGSTYLTIGDIRNVAQAQLDRGTGIATFRGLKGNTLELDGQTVTEVPVVFRLADSRWTFVRLGPQPVVLESPPAERILPTGGALQIVGGGQTPLGRPPQSGVPVAHSRPVPILLSPAAALRQGAAQRPNGQQLTPTAPVPARVFATITPAAKPMVIARVAPVIQAPPKGMGVTVTLETNGSNMIIAWIPGNGNRFEAGLASFLKRLPEGETMYFSLDSKPVLSVVRSGEGLKRSWIVRPLEKNSLKLRGDSVTAIRIRLNQADRAEEIVAVKDETAEVANA